MSPENRAAEPTEDRRVVTLERLAKGRYRAMNAAGDTLEFGTGGGDGTFSPVELLLTAMAGCTAIDVDFIVGNRAEPTSARIRSEGVKIRDEQGNHMVDFAITFDVQFAPDDAGRAGEEALPRAIARSNDRVCIVSRTVQLGASVTASRGPVEAAPLG